MIRTVQALVIIIGYLSLSECGIINSGLGKTQIKLKELTVGDNFQLCCPFRANNNNALFMFINGTKHFAIKVDGEIKQYEKEWNGSLVGDEFCFEKKIEISQKNILVKCETLNDGGLGQTVESLEFDARTVNRPRVTNFTVVSNATHAKLECSAEGSPNLQVSLHTSSGEEIVSRKTDNTALVVRKETEILSPDSYYKCIAKSSFVNFYESVNETESNFTPIIEYYEPSVNTLIDVQHTISIRVKSQPEPKISCSPRLDFEKESAVGNVYKFSAKFLPVQREDLKRYTCTASNKHGYQKFTTVLHLEPTSAKKSSDDFSIFDDYYQLTWSTESKARLENFTVIVKEKDEKNADLVQNETIRINKDDKIESNTASLDRRSDLYTISYHVKNLRAGTNYVATITDCNPYGCQTDSVEFTTGSNGNKIKKDYFDKPPPLAAAMSQSNSNQGLNCAQMSSLTGIMLIWRLV